MIVIELGGRNEAQILPGFTPAEAAIHPWLRFGRRAPSRRIESSEKSHFFRVDVKEWDSIIAEFEHSLGASS